MRPAPSGFARGQPRFLRSAPLSRLDFAAKAAHLRRPTCKARWRSGDAADCKSVHAGSIPARASISLSRHVHRRPENGFSAVFSDITSRTIRTDLHASEPSDGPDDGLLSGHHQRSINGRDGRNKRPYRNGGEERQGQGQGLQAIRPRWVFTAHAYSRR